jgi:hypothetical protein
MINIEGIEYHPKQRKKGRYCKLWMLILPIVFSVVIIVYYYFSDEKTPKKSNTSLIIVKKPKSDKAQVTSIPVNIETITTKLRPEDSKMLESLDEVNQFHKK